MVTPCLSDMRQVHHTLSTWGRCVVKNRGWSWRDSWTSIFELRESLAIRSKTIVVGMQRDITHAITSDSLSSAVIPVRSWAYFVLLGLLAKCLIKTCNHFSQKKEQPVGFEALIHIYIYCIYIYITGIHPEVSETCAGTRWLHDLRENSGHGIWN